MTIGEVTVEGNVLERQLARSNHHPVVDGGGQTTKAKIPGPVKWLLQRLHINLHRLSLHVTLPGGTVVTLGLSSGVDVVSFLSRDTGLVLVLLFYFSFTSELGVMRYRVTDPPISLPWLSLFSLA